MSQSAGKGSRLSFQSNSGRVRIPDDFNGSVFNQEYLTQPESLARFVDARQFHVPG